MDVSGKYNRDLKKTIQALISRTQGADIYRTGMYSLCQHYVNEGDKGWVEAHSNEVLQVAKTLILAEIKAKLEMNTALATLEAREAELAAKEAELNARLASIGTPGPGDIRAETASGGNPGN